MSQLDMGEKRWGEIKKLWRDNQWLYVVVGIAVGFVISAFWSIDMRSFVEGLVPEAFGIFFTVLVIDRLAERRDKKQLFQELAWQMKNHNNAIATEASYLLREYEWLTDGSLKNSKFHRGNFEEMWLDDANLEGCDFSRANLHLTYLSQANLRSAKGLTVEKLSQVNSLRGATMPDGSKYDGRYNLPSDLRNAKRENLDTSDDHAMAQFYGVPLDIYQVGQLAFGQHDRNDESS